MITPSRLRGLVRTPPRGFTLVEVLVAVFIFSIIAVMAYGGYSQGAMLSTQARERMKRLEELQTAVRLLTQDFEQIAPRPVRDLLGQSFLPALTSDARSEYLVQLTRAGWSNPAGVQRSSLQRVQYVLDDQTLRREHWPVLDTTLANEQIKRDLITGVKEVQLRFLDTNKQWQEQWPPLGAQTAVAMGPRMRPLAVEVTLELDDFGKIVRLIEVGG